MIEGEFQFVRDWVYAPFIAAVGGIVSFFYGILKNIRADVKDNDNDIEALKEKQGRIDERLKSLEKKND